MIKLETKYKRPTEKDHGHTDIFHNGKCIGYIIQDRSEFRAVNENWHFCPKTIDLRHISASNRKKILEKIKMWLT